MSILNHTSCFLNGESLEIENFLEIWKDISIFIHENTLTVPSGTAGAMYYVFS